MEIIHSQSAAKGLFYIDCEKGNPATMEYTMADKLMIINHTEVDDVLRGKMLATN